MVIANFFYTVQVKLSAERKRGTLIHCLWECTNLQQWWKSVVEFLTIGKEIPLRAKLLYMPEG